MPGVADEFGRIDGIPDLSVRIDGAWRRQCRARLKAMGKNQNDLGRHVGGAQGGVSQALSLRRSQKRSRFALRISAALRVPVPLAAQVEVVAMALLDRGEDARVRGIVLMFRDVLSHELQGLLDLPAIPDADE